MIRFIVFTTLLLATCIAVAQPAVVEPPVAKKEAKVDTVHGELRVDNYFWLRNKGSAEVTNYLRKENDYAEAVMKPARRIQMSLYDEAVNLIDDDQEIVLPYLENGYWYSSYYEDDNEWETYYRSTDEAGRNEELILDANDIAPVSGYFEIKNILPSPDNNILAYAVDRSGDLETDWFFRDTENEKYLKDKLARAGDIAWCSDSKHVYYTVLNDTNRYSKVYVHELGTPASQDKLVFHEKDPVYSLYVELSLSGDYIMLTVSGINASEVYFIAADDYSGNFTQFAPRKEGHLYYPAHGGGDFVVMSNKDRKNFMLYSCSPENPEPDAWEPILSVDDDVYIADYVCYQDYIMAEVWQDGVANFWCIDRSDHSVKELKFTEPSYTLYWGDNYVADTDEFRYEYYSFKESILLCEYNMSTGQTDTLLREHMFNYDSEDYVSDLVFATARDGEQVPISVFRHKDTELDGSAPLILEGYGAYGVGSEIWFDFARLPLVDRGGIYAVAHVRGGGEMGWNWYEDGRVMNKLNSFNDFIDCAEYLIAEDYTYKGGIAATGASAGGLLMGGVMNMRPDLFQTIILEVPFLDVVNSMLDPSLPLTIEEYPEWGNPQDKAVYEYMMQYSPYDNVKAQDYPHLIFITAINDEQVPYWEPAKTVAKLRELKTNDNLVILKTDMMGGHGGYMNWYDQLEERTWNFAFVLYMHELTNK